MSERARSRLRRLEEAAQPAGKWIIIDERDGDAQEQIERRRAAGELSDRDMVVIVRAF